MNKLLHSSTSLGYAKLPKLNAILQKSFGLMQEDKLTYKEAATEVVKEVKEVWKHHFGLRVIEGQDYDGEKVEKEVAEEKKMIKRDQHIQDMVVAHMKELTDLRYKARRKVRRKNFETREAELVKMLKHL